MILPKLTFAGGRAESFAKASVVISLPTRRPMPYRTAAGAEIDLVIKLSSNEIWAIEIKVGVAPKISKNFRQTCQDVQATKKYVVYGGDDEFPVGGGVTVISLRKLMEKLQS